MKPTLKANKMQSKNPAVKSDMDMQFDRWKANPNQDTLNTLVNASMPTLNSAATSYARGQQDQVIAQAKMLAIKAFGKYNPSSGTRLRTYLMIQLQPLNRVAHRRRTSVRIPEQASRAIYGMGSIRRNLTNELGREPSDAEMSDNTGLSTSRVRLLSKYDSPEAYEGSAFDEQGIPIFSGTQKEDPNQINLELVHFDLGPIDQQILEWKKGMYDKPILSTQEIAKRLNMTSSAVSQHAAKIQSKIPEDTSLWA